MSKLEIEKFCEIINGKYPTQKTKPGKYPLVVTAKERKSSETYQINAKAICIPKVSSTGHGHASIKRIHYEEGEFALANIMFALIPDEKICNPKYLFHLLSHKKDELLVPLMTGSANVSLDPKEVKSIKLDLPSISKQEHVIQILDKIHTIIRKNQEIVELLNELTHSLFIKWFGDPISNSKKLEIQPLGEILENVQYGTSSKLDLTEGIPCLRMNNITEEGFVDTTDLKYLSDVSEQEKYLLNKLDILFNRTNSNELVGKTAIFDVEEDFTFAGYLIRLVVDQQKCDPYYVNSYMNLPEIKFKIREMRKKAINQANINAKKIQTLPITVPPLPTQSKFVEIRKEIIKEWKKQVELGRYYSELEKSINAKLFENIVI